MATTNKVVHEAVPFRLYQMPCCGHLVCWINPRAPNYCPECGEFVFHLLRGTTETVEAMLSYQPEEIKVLGGRVE